MAILEADSPKKLMRSISCDTVGLTGGRGVRYARVGSEATKPSQMEEARRRRAGCLVDKMSYRADDRG